MPPDWSFLTPGLAHWFLPRAVKLRKESFLEIAAIGIARLALRLAVGRLRFQPSGWTLDFLAYAEDAWSKDVSSPEISWVAEVSAAHPLDR
jgi:hypothetical protein